MNRREVIALLGAAATCPFAARAQLATIVPRLCILSFDPIALRARRFGVFLESLRDLGHVEEKTIHIDWMSADGVGERFPALAAECLRRKADVIVAPTTPATLAAKSLTRTVPIVMLGLIDPVANGLVDSLARPGGNVTGTTSVAPGMTAKRLELLNELVPDLSRVLVLAYVADPVAAGQIRELEQTAGKLNVKLLLHEVRTADDITAAFNRAVQGGRPQGMLTTAENIFAAEHARVNELSAKLSLPAVYSSAGRVRTGGLMSYSAVFPDIERRTAAYVDRIIKGANPSDLPVQEPAIFELVINLKAAKALGVSIPPSLLARADEVIE